MTDSTTDTHESENGQNLPAAPSRRVVYISSAEGRSYADLLPSNIGRSSIVHSLIEALDLLQEENVEEDDGDDVDEKLQGASEIHTEDAPSAANIIRARVLEPLPATRSDLCRFHDKAYIEALFEASANFESPENSFDSDVIQPSPTKRAKLDEAQVPPEVSQKGAEVSLDGNADGADHGLEHDCPVFRGLEEYCCHVAGGAITAARELRQGRADVALFWDGGRHHATKSAAAGFCYINDIVLAILELQKNPLFDKKRFPPDTGAGLAKVPKRIKKVLYIDLDLHHGDGVAEAFETNPNVVTVSLHLWSKGFYPSTPKGHLEYTGPPPPSSAANTTLNIAVPKSGLSDANFNYLVRECVRPIFEAVHPNAVVLQCGIDGLAGDPCKESNISLKGYGVAVNTILSWCRTSQTSNGEQSCQGGELRDPGYIPVLLLGGGGYHSTNAARAWAYLTSIVLGRPLNLEVGTVPDTCTHWETFYNDGAAGEGLDVPAHLSRRDENTSVDMEAIVERFKSYARSLAAQ